MKLQWRTYSRNSIVGSMFPRTMKTRTEGCSVKCSSFHAAWLSVEQPGFSGDGEGWRKLEVRVCLKRGGGRSHEYL